MFDFLGNIFQRDDIIDQKMKKVLGGRRDGRLRWLGVHGVSVARVGLWLVFCMF